MTEERFSIAAAQHEAVVLVVSLGSRTEVKQGTATWKPTDIPDSDSRHAAVRTADGELHTGNWLRIPVKPITRSGGKPITCSGANRSPVGAKRRGTKS